MAHSKFCYLVKFATLLTLLRCSAALPSVTILEPCDSHTCTVPKTLPDNVTFECVLNSPTMSGPIWEITRSSSQLALENRGLQIIFASNLLQSQGYLLKNPFQNYSTLDITKQARQEHTQIRVQCIEFAETENMASDYYYVFTYGAPDPPQKFALQASSSSPSLSSFLTWKRPPNIPEDVPLTYHLQITNLTSNVSRVYNMTDMLSYTLHMPEGSGCSLFEFSITASNDVGNSTPMSIVETLPITPDVGPINSSLQILSVNVGGESVAVTLAFDEAETCSEKYSVSDYTVVSSDGSIRVRINASSDVNSYNVTLDSVNAPNISRGFAYDISVIACIDISDTACNTNGCQESTQFCRESKTIEVFTTDVQNPKVRYIGANINLTCDFAEGSTAEGCFFNFTGYNTEPQTFFVSRSGNSSVATTCDVADAAADDKNYEWSAFDDIGGVPITVELIPVDSWDEDNFTCRRDTRDQTSGEQGLTGGQIGGIVVGVVLMVLVPTAIIIVIATIMYHKSPKKLKHELGSSSKHPKKRVRPDGDEPSKEERVAAESGEEVQKPLLTCMVKLLPGKKRIIEFEITEWNDTAIENKISTASGNEITLELTELTELKKVTTV